MPSLMSDRALATILNARSLREITWFVDSSFETFHGATHNWVGGVMVHLPNSPSDPMFFLHHGFIDCLFTWMRENQRKQGVDVDFNYPNDTQALGVGTRRQGDGRRIQRVEDSYHYALNEMRPFAPLRNIDGLSSLYEQDHPCAPRPTCSRSDTSCGGAPYLFCDTSHYKCAPKLRLGADCRRFNRDEPCAGGVCCNGRCQEKCDVDRPSRRPSPPSGPPARTNTNRVRPNTRHQDSDNRYPTRSRPEQNENQRERRPDRPRIPRPNRNGIRRRPNGADGPDSRRRPPPPERPANRLRPSGPAGPPTVRRPHPPMQETMHGVGEEQEDTSSESSSSDSSEETDFHLSRPGFPPDQSESSESSEETDLSAERSPNPNRGSHPNRGSISGPEAPSSVHNEIIPIREEYAAPTLPPVPTHPPYILPQIPTHPPGYDRIPPVPTHPPSYFAAFADLQATYNLDNDEVPYEPSEKKRRSLQWKSEHPTQKKSLSTEIKARNVKKGTHDSSVNKKTLIKDNIIKKVDKTSGNVGRLSRVNPTWIVESFRDLISHKSRRPSSERKEIPYAPRDHY